MKKPYKITRITFLIQGIYTLLTALWGLIDIKSFMAVSGPKTDIWLVKTVSVALICIALSLLTNLKSESNLAPKITLALTSALGLCFIDFYYSLNGVIWKTYQVDGVIQILFIIIWTYIIFRLK